MALHATNFCVPGCHVNSWKDVANVAKPLCCSGARLLQIATVAYLLNYSEMWLCPVKWSVLHRSLEPELGASESQIAMMAAENWFISEQIWKILDTKPGAQVDMSARSHDWYRSTMNSA